MKFAVLIATRNRPQQLNTLLGSLSKSVDRISQVTIVSSGENISEIINNHRPYLPLTYFHSEISGQIAQKMKGIELISSKTDWVLFLDDDLVIPDDVHHADTAGHRNLVTKFIGLLQPSDKTGGRRLLVHLAGTDHPVESSALVVLAEAGTPVAWDVDHSRPIRLVQQVFDGHNTRAWDRVTNLLCEVISLWLDRLGERARNWTRWGGLCD